MLDAHWSENGFGGGGGKGDQHNQIFFKKFANHPRWSYTSVQTTVPVHYSKIRLGKPCATEVSEGFWALVVTTTLTQRHGIPYHLTIFIHWCKFASKTHGVQNPSPLLISSLATLVTRLHPVIIFLLFIPIIFIFFNQYCSAKLQVNIFIFIFLFLTFLREECFFVPERRQLFGKEVFEDIYSLNC